MVYLTFSWHQRHYQIPHNFLHLNQYNLICNLFIYFIYSSSCCKKCIFIFCQIKYKKALVSRTDDLYLNLKFSLHNMMFTSICCLFILLLQILLVLKFFPSFNRPPPKVVQKSAAFIKENKLRSSKVLGQWIFNYICLLFLS